MLKNKKIFISSNFSYLNN